ncbi:MAG: sigma 54-interacting transcriptional regulator [Paludibacterium sp.]|uniref:sigma-54 interaction domain-containing protein n=1 Tax=Paludibacterium sp. TaxID=1917523 RepID=UPI0025F037BA|nr:sigma 54-interacting transcriptional regulator [Paludibacterium sp.]MBV8045922.1 sigma 54-interacting transcriptional regulator [Paludibacterium sp.]MBV8647323.1 sigma 54-interacting transcriptional regulator [Paludibacterium sp.]
MHKDQKSTSAHADELVWLVQCLKDGLDDLDRAVTVIDRDGRFVYYNRASARMDGVDPAQVLGRPILEATPWLDPEHSTLLRCLRDKRGVHDSYQAYDGPGGHKMHYRHSAQPIFGRDGRLIGAIEIGRIVRDMPRDVDANKALPPEILTADARMAEQIDRIDAYAGTDLPILIYGETGTGKELFARRAHAMSTRAARPMLCLNCAAIPDTLLESTLFGTTRGAFTGAENRKGLFALADGGTLFLDEINSMPTSLQSKLLRVLQDGSFSPLGSQQTQQADVRLVAALNQQPREAVRQERLREDLYYRLNVGYIAIPPLRERPDDVHLLARHFIALHAARLESDVTTLGPDALRQLRRHTWPGNARELENAIQRSILLHRGNPAMLDHIVMEDTEIDAGEQRAGATLDVALARQEAAWITHALTMHGGNVSQAALALGLARTTLISRMKRLNLWARDVI